jgi:hypothetical protein
VTTAGRTRRIAWFADLESLVPRLDALERLVGEIGLTTVAPESHLSHTSGFSASPEVAEASPLADWRERPGLRDHREFFGVPEPAMAVLPGVLGGVDDAPLLRVIDECRRLGLEIWGHAGVWSYGAEVFPEFAAVDLWGRPLVPGSLPWGTMFCPSKSGLNAWIADSLRDVAERYDLDGWFLDHARFTSPGHSQTLAACGCPDCAAAARERGVDLDDVRNDLRGLADDLRRLEPNHLLALAHSGPVGIAGFLAGRPGVLDWLYVRAAILAERFGSLHRAVAEGSPRVVDFGSDVFPPSVALLGGHVYERWADAGATYLTGGFGERIGWGSVGRVTAKALGATLAGLVPGLTASQGCEAMASLVGASASATPDDDLDAYLTELSRMAAACGGLPVYPPIAGPPGVDVLARMCDGIVEAGLDGAMLAGLETTTAEQQLTIRSHLSGRLL